MNREVIVHHWRFLTLIAGPKAARYGVSCLQQPQVQRRYRHCRLRRCIGQGPRQNRDALLNYALNRRRAFEDLH